MVNFYTILGINEKANNGEIEAAYKKRVLSYHPDKNQNSDVSHHMTQILNEARASLLDSNKRLEHDYALGVKKRPEPIPLERIVVVPNKNEPEIRREGFNEGVGKTLLGVALTGLVLAFLNDLED